MERTKMKKVPGKTKELSISAKRSVHRATNKINRKGGAAMIGGAAGAVVGAAVGGITGAAMVDKKTRIKVNTALNNFAETAANTIDNVTEQIADATDSTRQTLEEVSEGAQQLKRQTKRIRE